MKVSAVSYLNTKPFLYGLTRSGIPGLELSVDIPSECARKLISGEVDLGLIPVAVIPLLKEAHILPGYCIGADGKVDSVKLYSRVPIEEVKTVYLDYQSRTSVMLAQVLAKELWNVQPEWVNSTAGYEGKIEGITGGVVIGDRTFYLNDLYEYEYDLAEEWKKLTGLPFVFACWVSNREPDPAFKEAFQTALEAGLQNIDKVIAEESLKYQEFDVEYYLRNSLTFRLDERMKQGMSLFLEKAAKLR